MTFKPYQGFLLTALTVSFVSVPMLVYANEVPQFVTRFPGKPLSIRHFRSEQSKNGGQAQSFSVTGARRARRTQQAQIEPPADNEANATQDSPSGEELDQPSKASHEELLADFEEAASVYEAAKYQEAIEMFERGVNRSEEADDPKMWGVFMVSLAGACVKAYRINGDKAYLLRAKDIVQAVHRRPEGVSINALLNRENLVQEIDTELAAANEQEAKEKALREKTLGRQKKSYTAAELRAAKKRTRTRATLFVYGGVCVAGGVGAIVWGAKGAQIGLGQLGERDVPTGMRNMTNFNNDEEYWRQNTLPKLQTYWFGGGSLAIGVGISSLLTGVLYDRIVARTERRASNAKTAKRNRGNIK